MTTIEFAESDDEILLCYPVMAELRPHLEESDFAARVREQQRESGFKLIYLIDGDIKAVAGIRVAHWLARGKSLDIEDLVAKDGERSKGYGGKLFDWIVEYARQENCCEIRLVSGVTRFDAHRFYLSKKMKIDAHFFSLPLYQK